MNCCRVPYRIKDNSSNAMLWIIRLILILEFYFKSAATGARIHQKGRKILPQSIPKFLPTPTNVTVNKGELAELTCHIENLGPRMVVWRKASDENPLTIGETTFIPEKEVSVDYDVISDKASKWNLLIKNVQPRHAGVYECHISSTTIYTHYIALNVINKPLRPKPRLEITGTEYVNQYSDIVLKCNATGVTRAPHDIDWFFQGNRIHTSLPRWYGRIEVMKRRPIPGRSYISELIIHLSTMEDQGNYVCRSSDLTVNSMKVHVLKAEKGSNGIKPRAPGEENRQNQDIRTHANNSAPTLRTSIRNYSLAVLFVILYSVCR